MKNLEEQKKLIAEKIMGWEVVGDDLGLIWIFKNKSDATSGLLLDEWKLDEDRNCWDEIWEKIDEDTWFRFMDILLLKLGVDPAFAMSDSVKWARILTAKPKICLKALYKTAESV